MVTPKRGEGGREICCWYYYYFPEIWNEHPLVTQDLNCRVTEGLPKFIHFIYRDTLYTTAFHDSVLLSSWKYSTVEWKIPNKICRICFYISRALLLLELPLQFLCRLLSSFVGAILIIENVWVCFFNGMSWQLSFERFITLKKQIWHLSSINGRVRIINQQQYQHLNHQPLK